MSRKLLIKGICPGEISLREASRVYHVPARTISGWHKIGALKGRRSGQYLLVDKRQLVKLKKRREQFLRKYGQVRGYRVVSKRRR